MEKLPPQLQDRFASIFTKEEMSNLETVFSLKTRPVSFRLNTLISSPEEVEEGLSSASIKFSKLDFPSNSYILDEECTESDIWKRRIYKDGHIYMQWLSSQIPVSLFNQESPLRILDACAAPGGKTSQLSALYPDAEIIAFEPFKVRYDKMQHNLKKLGCKNVTAYNDQICNLKNYIKETGYFDMILVDAPCSSEGWLSLHNDKFLEAWDISHVRKNYKRQKFIIWDVLPFLKDGWEFIYTTCTLAPEENEWVAHYVLCNHPEMQLEKLDLPENKYIKESHALKSFGKYIYKTEVSEKCIRVIPTKYSEWFFIAKFKKYE
jgi:16S rRNA C967 or C1407 C5-methylase (RsmB/RsmF family)